MEKMMMEIFADNIMDIDFAAIFSEMVTIIKYVESVMNHKVGNVSLYSETWIVWQSFLWILPLASLRTESISHLHQLFSYQELTCTNDNSISSILPNNVNIFSFSLNGMYLSTTSTWTCKNLLYFKCVLEEGVVGKQNDESKKDANFYVMLSVYFFPPSDSSLV